MILHRTPRLPFFALTALILAFGQTGCSGDNAAAPIDKLCGGQPGFGARIAGAPEPVDMCVSNDEVTTIFDSFNNRYWLQATFTSDTLTFEVSISFDLHRNLPRQLNVTPDSTLAVTDPDGALFHYKETSQRGARFVSSAVSGTLTLTFSEIDVAVGTFSDLVIDLEDASSGTSAGVRAISEGFFAVSPD